MPQRSLRPCRKHGCSALSRTGYCAAHADEAKRYARISDQHRGSARARGYTTAWEKARKAYLAMHPLCVQCHAEHVVRAATVVDHITPHRGDMALFWDAQGNWQALCREHHDRKTARGE